MSGSGFPRNWFIGSDPEDLGVVCNICLDVACEPLQCIYGHIFCTNCLEIRNCSFCPCCAEDGNSTDAPFSLNLVAKKVIQTLSVICHINEKCNWKGPLKDQTNHPCLYRPFGCANKGCLEMMNTFTQFEHKSVCLKRMTTCENCQGDFKAESMFDHIRTCKDSPVTCLCGSKVSSSSWTAHKEVCMELSSVPVPLMEPTQHSPPQPKKHAVCDYCQGRVPVDNLSLHMNFCLERPVYCDYGVSVPFHALSVHKAKCISTSTGSPPSPNRQPSPNSCRISSPCEFCDARVLLVDLPDHLRICVERAIRCQCGINIPARAMPAHKTDACILKGMLVGEFCDERVEVEGLTEQTCTEKPRDVKCGCGVSVAPDRLQSHQKYQCTLSGVKCGKCNILVSQYMFLSHKCAKMLPPRPPSTSPKTGTHSNTHSPYASHNNSFRLAASEDKSISPPIRENASILSEIPTIVLLSDSEDEKEGEEEEEEEYC